MSINIVSHSTPNGDSPTQEELTFNRDESGAVTFSEHEILTRLVVPFLFRELRQALTRLSTFDSQAAYEAAINVNVELLELAVQIKGGE